MLDGRKMGGQYSQLLMMVEAQQESKPWLKPREGTMTPSLKIDSVSTIPLLNVGDTIREFSIYAKLKIESGDRDFEFRVKFSGQDLIQNLCPFPH